MGKAGNIFTAVNRLERDAFMSGRDHLLLVECAFKLGVDQFAPLLVGHWHKVTEELVRSRWRLRRTHKSCSRPSLREFRPSPCGVCRSPLQTAAARRHSWRATKEALAPKHLVPRAWLDWPTLEESS